MSEEEVGPAAREPSPFRGLAALITGNVSVIAAAMVYMGWAYDTSYYGYFQLSPTELNTSTLDYIFTSLNLFLPVIVFVVMCIVISVSIATGAVPMASSAMAVVQWAARLVRTVPRLRWLSNMIPQGTMTRLSRMQQWLRREAKFSLTFLGAALTLAGLFSLNSSSSSFIKLGLLAFGSLVITWPLRSTRVGRILYSVAIAVSIACGFGMTSLYASGLGRTAAQGFAAHLPAEREVAVYSVESLALPGPGVMVQRLPTGAQYHYRYTGLRLFQISSGTYYLLPADWSPQMATTFLVEPSEQVSVELYNYSP